MRTTDPAPGTAGRGLAEAGSAPSASPRPGLDRRVVLLAGAVLLLAVCAGASLAVGAGRTPPQEVWRALTGYAGTNEHVIVRDIRVPRTILAICVGAALGTAGTLIQTLTRNPLAEPGILGVTSGAGFAITVGTVLGIAGSQTAQLGLALVGAVVASLVVYGVGRTVPLRLVLAGVAFTFVLSGMSLALRLLYPDVLDRFRFWSVGSLAGREQTPFEVPLLAIVLALAGALLATRPLSGIALGEDVAHALGARVARTRVAVLALVTVLAGAATAVAGPIAFVGLIVPHLARHAARGSIPWLMGYTMLLGPILMLVSDIGARVLLPTGEVPVAVVTAFLGGPALIWVVRRYGAVEL
ncbi:FecCD family ABC transporter permease [Actinomadura livida]|uniref:Fe(3+)-siderophore ABC transporter permease n=1 Tax=Actinomadura livida TaxID=79909 RepID=A0A7W7IIT2_9ACTN|nr:MULTISPECIES: iron ABC transporter permease [Actinomadura]MBB4777894.1 iron complex transport system permease protein [Actinomadura catellatispora]GGT97939.1 iron ABC transporter permease [Actinomadura livida]